MTSRGCWNAGLASLALCVIWIGMLTAAGPAAASGCPAANPHAEYISLTPPSGALPIHTSVTLDASVGLISGAISTAKPGETVQFHVVCGPGAGLSGSARTAAQSPAAPKVYTAPFSIRNNGQRGESWITATITYHGTTSTAVATILWTPPLPSCDAAIRWYAALKCTALYQMAHTVLEAGECTVAVASLTLPQADLVKVIDAATSVGNAERAASEVGASSSFGALIADIRGLQEGVSVAKLRTALSDSHSAEGLITNIWDLVHTLPAGEIERTAEALASLAGLGPCVSMLKGIQTTPTSQTGVSRTFSNATLGLNTGNPDVVGFGAIRPSEVSMSEAGDTGRVWSIHWHSWGGSQATGTGSANWIWPGWCEACGSETLPATVTASELHRCGGHEAYEDIEWFFPSRGQSFNVKLNSTDLCSGHIGSGQQATSSHATCASIPSADVDAISETDSSCLTVERLLDTPVLRSHVGHNAKFTLDGWWCGSELSMQVGGSPQSFSCEQGDFAYVTFNVL
jgi:hypothetical protein